MAAGGSRRGVPASRKFVKTVAEFHGYISGKASFRTTVTTIGTAGVLDRLCRVDTEAGDQQTVRQKQQMRWTKKGAHILLQVRTQALNRYLRATFERWKPTMASTDISPVLAA